MATSTSSSSSALLTVPAGGAGVASAPSSAAAGAAGASTSSPASSGESVRFPTRYCPLPPGMLGSQWSNLCFSHGNRPPPRPILPAPLPTYLVFYYAAITHGSAPNMADQLAPSTKASEASALNDFQTFLVVNKKKGASYPPDSGGIAQVPEEVMCNSAIFGKYMTWGCLTPGSHPSARSSLGVAAASTMIGYVSHVWGWVKKSYKANPFVIDTERRAAEGKASWKSAMFSNITHQQSLLLRQVGEAVSKCRIDYAPRRAWCCSILRCSRLHCHVRVYLVCIDRCPPLPFFRLLAHILFRR